MSPNVDPRLPILRLTFHGIGVPRRVLEPGEERVWLARDRFLAILSAAKDAGNVEITFDDGNCSDLDTAVPALHDCGLRATFFILSGRVGIRGSLSADGLRQILAAGMEIGSHGMEHRPWRELDPAAARRELVDAKDRLEQLIGRRVCAAACPYGAYGRRTLQQVRRAGFDALYTSDGGLGRGADWLRVRNTVKAGDDASIVGTLRTLPIARRWVLDAKRFVKRLR
jgi:peptidoglycan/xylan/chitin deacetylase (PgdA/CDA1 family)